MNIPEGFELFVGDQNGKGRKRRGMFVSVVGTGRYSLCFSLYHDTSSAWGVEVGTALDAYVKRDGTQIAFIPAVEGTYRVTNITTHGSKRVSCTGLLRELSIEAKQTFPATVLDGALIITIKEADAA